MYIYYLFFSLLLILSVGSDKTIFARFISAAILLFLFSALRGEYIDFDYEGYLGYYELVIEEVQFPIEPTFRALVGMSESLFSSPLFLFVTYAALGIATKFAAIWRLTPFRMSAVLVYYGGFFILWEMTQIRTGVATGFVLLSVLAVRERRLALFSIFIALGSLFHYSVMFLPFIYIFGVPSLITKYRRYVGAVIIMLLFISFVNIDLTKLVEYIPNESIQSKLLSYDTLNDVTPNTFNWLFFSRLALFVFLLSFRKQLIANNEYFIILIWMYFTGLMIHVLFATGSGLATRFSETLFVSEIILIPQLISLLRFRFVGLAIPVLAGMAFLAFNLHYLGLLQPYEINSGLFIKQM